MKQSGDGENQAYSQSNPANFCFSPNREAHNYYLGNNLFGTSEASQTTQSNQNRQQLLNQIANNSASQHAYQMTYQERRMAAQYVAQKIYREKHFDEPPPAEPKPDPQDDCWTFNGQVFHDYNEFFRYVESYNETKKMIRSATPFDNINYLNCTYGSAFPEYQLFDKVPDYRIAVPQKVESFENPKYLSHEEYDEMRQDFESNGYHVDGAALQNFNVDDFSFPPLKVLPEQFSVLSQLWKISDDVNPMISSNANLNGNFSAPDEQISPKRRLKPNKKSLEDVSVQTHQSNQFMFSFPALRLLQEQRR